MDTGSSRTVDCPSENALLLLVRSSATLEEIAPILEHLDCCPGCRALAAELARASAPPLGDTPRGVSRDAPEPPLRDAGAVVGRYVILQHVGRGGMADVYAAYDPELDRKVALKFVRGGATRVTAAHLAREASALARMSHANVVAVYDVGYSGDELYVVMEFVNGTTLRGWLASEPRRAREILDVLRDAARGLVAAHGAKLVHRDIKPENIMVDRQGRAKITDFGLARDFRGDSTGELAGTLMYMSPEQLLGNAVDERSDQFSFALTMAEALTGRRPFEGTTRSELLDSLRRGNPALRFRAGRTLPRGLSRVLSRALAYRPDDRFASVEEFLSALALRRSRPWAVGAVVLASAVLATAAVVTLEQRHSAAPQVCSGAESRLAGVWDDARRDEVTRAFDALSLSYAEDQSRTVRAVLDQQARAWTAAYTASCERTRIRKDQSEQVMDDQMACLDDRRREMRALTSELAHPDATIAQHAVQAVGALSSVDRCLDLRGLARARHLDPAMNARVAELEDSLARAKAAIDVGEFGRAKPDVAAMVTSAQQIGDRHLEAAAQLLSGQALRAASQYPEAQKAFMEGAWAGEADGDDELVARCWMEMARVTAGAMGRVADAVPYTRQAAASVSRAGSPPDLQASLLRLEALNAQMAGDYQNSIALGREALRMVEAGGRAESREAAECLNLIGSGFVRLNRHEDAEENLLAGLAMLKRVLGPQHPAVATALFNVALLDEESGRFEEARARLTEASTLLRDAGAERDPVLPSIEALLGGVDYQLGDIEAAGRYYAQAVALEKSQVGDSDHLLGMYCDYGEFLLAEKRLPEATGVYEDAAAMLARLTGVRPAHQVAIGTGLALVDLGWHRPDKALSRLEPLVQRCSDAEMDADACAGAKFAMARTLAALGQRPNDARRLAEAARQVYAGEPKFYTRELAEVSAFLQGGESTGAPHHSG